MEGNHSEKDPSYDMIRINMNYDINIFSKEYCPNEIRIFLVTELNLPLLPLLF